jgi:hypothetical protein
MRNNTNITENLNFFNDYVIIPDDFIYESDTWEIRANSPSTSGNITVPKDVFESQENIQIQIELPISQGNLTTYLFSSSNQLVYSHSQSFSQSDVVVLIPISMNIDEGLYEIHTYWHGDNQAGIQKQSVYIKKPSESNLIPLLITLIVVLISSLTIALSSYSYIKYKHSKIIKEDHESKLNNAKKESERSHRNLLFNLYKDHFSLKHVIINQKDTGINLYYQCFSLEEINHILVSGFLEAIHNFGKTIFHRKDQSIYVKIEFQDSIMVMLEYYNFKICFVFDEEPTLEFVKTIKELSNEVENEFSHVITEFENDLTKFIGIRDIINDYLLVALIYPIRLKIPSVDMINQYEGKIIKEVLEYMKSNNITHFFVRDIVSLDEFNEKKAQSILNLIKKEIFNPIYDPAY